MGRSGVQWKGGRRRRGIARSALALAGFSVALLPSPARAAVISFDDLDPPGRDGAGLTVNAQYENQGVTFNDLSAFDYSEGPNAIPNFPRSPNVAVEPCVGAEFCTSPARASFTVAQQDVRVWVGFAYQLNAPRGVRLTGFDASSNVVGTADATLAANPNPTPISVPLAINLGAPAIRRIEVSVTTGGGYTGGLAVDDVEFTTIGPPPPCTASAPPTVSLERPAAGLVVDEDSFPLQGTVSPNGAPITSASVRTTRLDTRTANVYPTLISRNGGMFGPTNFGGMLDVGAHDVVVTATNCAGTGTSEPRRVTRTVPNPEPQPTACVPQPDHRAVEVAESAAELAAILNSDFKGQVVVPSGSRFDMDPYRPLELKPGVQLVGERADLGRRPLLHADDLTEFNMFRVTGPDVCVEGLTIFGPTTSPGKVGPYSHGIEVVQDPVTYANPEELEPVVIADNEMVGWPGGAVLVSGTVRYPPCSYSEGEPCREAPDGYDGPRVSREAAAKMRVEGNYIHHNARESGGYGVVVDSSSWATITGNVFDYNRHAVTSAGMSFSGYIARFNYLLEGGYTYGSNGYYGAHFDVHGSMDPGHWVGGVAGEYHEIAYNTIRGDQRYGGFQGHFQQVRPALGLRGRTTDVTHFHDNVLAHEYGVAVRFKGGDDDRLDRPSDFNYRGGGNQLSTDRSRQIAAGDFDADGRTDVFLTNGSGWFFSRAGIRPWEYLRPSNKLVGNLGFADIDNDDATDVLYRDGAGNLGYVKSGSAEGVTPLTQVPVPVRDLRFGDFDGDGLTDIFYTRDRQWHVWHGATREWALAAGSNQPLSGLLFGEFDDKRGTDVAAVTRDEWSYSSGAIEAWAKLNEKRVPSFQGAVAADFDGNGRTDIAVGDKAWRYSPDGRGPLQTLRRDVASPYLPLHRLLIGSFNGEPRATVVAFGEPRSKRFGIWRGLGSQHSFVKLSEQDMR